MAEWIVEEFYGLPEPPAVRKWRAEGLQQGLEQGLQQGREEGREEIILRQLTRRFGALPEAVVAQIRALHSPQLLDLGDALFDFTALEDVTAWLAAHTPPAA